MNGFNISRRDFLRNSSFAIAGTVGGILASGGCGTPPRSGKRKAVLWVGGFAHDFDAFAEIMTEFLPKYLNIDIEVVTDGSFLDSSNFDVIIMNHCFESADGVLTDAQKTTNAFVTGAPSVQSRWTSPRPTTCKGCLSIASQPRTAGRTTVSGRPSRRLTGSSPRTCERSVKEDHRNSN